MRSEVGERCCLFLFGFIALRNDGIDWEDEKKKKETAREKKGRVGGEKRVKMRRWGNKKRKKKKGGRRRKRIGRRGDEKVGIGAATAWAQEEEAE